MNLFLIAPQKSDPLFDEKKQILVNASKDFGLNFYYTPGQAIYNDLDLKKNAQLLKKIDFFIADLSYERPSCYFEVGFVQGMNKPVDLIATFGTTIHQVLNKDKTRFYHNLYEYEILIVSILNSRVIPSV